MAYEDNPEDEYQRQFQLQNQQNTGIAGPQPVMAAPEPKPAGGYDYEQFRKTWYGSDGWKDPEAWMKANSAFTTGATLKGGQHLYDPQGRYLADIVGNLNDPTQQKHAQWLKGDTGLYSTKKAAPAPKKAAGSGSGGGGGAAAPGAGTGGGYTSNLAGQSGDLFSLLMERARGSENVDPNDPIIKAQTDAYRSEGVNARRDFLAAQAEAAGPYGNQRSEERRSAEQLGKSVGGFQGQAMQNELTARRAKIQHALDSGAQFLSEQQRMALQNELTRLQLAQQESQFGRNLSLENRRLSQQGSQFDRSLAQSGSQFDRNLNQRGYEYDTSRWDDIFG